MTPFTRLFRSAKLATPVALAAFIALTIAPAATPAATVTSKTERACATTGDVNTSWNKQLALPGFDASKGRLIAVDVSQMAWIKSDFTALNAPESGEASTIEVSLNSASVRIQIPGTAQVLRSLVPKSEKFVLAPGEARGGSFGEVTSGFVDAAIPASEFATWIGTGTITVPTSAAAASAISEVGGNADSKIRTIARTEACVVYTYTEEILVCVGDYVWIDANKNGIQDAGEQPVPGRSITVTDINGLALGSATTDASGRWSVCNLEPNTPCIINIDLPEGYTLALSNQGTNDTVDSDAVANGTDATIRCMTPPRDKDLTFDAGVYVNDVPTAVQAARPTVLRAAKRSFSRVVASGGVATFSVTVSNPSTATVRNISVCDTPPPALTFTSRPKGSFISNGRLCWKVASLAAGKSVTFKYTMRSAKVARQVCVVNRVAANVAGSTSAGARASVCIRPTKIAALPLAG